MSEADSNINESYEMFAELSWKASIELQKQLTLNGKSQNKHFAPSGQWRHPK